MTFFSTFQKESTAGRLTGVFHLGGIWELSGGKECVLKLCLQKRHTIFTYIESSFGLPWRLVEMLMEIWRENSTHSIPATSISFAQPLPTIGWLERPWSWGHRPPGVWLDIRGIIGATSEWRRWGSFCSSLCSEGQLHWEPASAAPSS